MFGTVLDWRLIRMADEKPKKTEAAPEYTVDQLISESRALLGCSRHVAVGALHGEERTKLTTTEGKAAVRSFLNRKAAVA